MKNKLLLFILALSIWQIVNVINVFADEVAFPAYTGYVNDYKGVLSAENKILLTRLAENLNNKTTAQLAVVIIDTCRPLDIETYAVKLFEKWGIGQKDKNNGVLLLVATSDRKVRIEVGYGLEGAIPDAMAKVIIDNTILPYFRTGDYNTGIVKGAFAVTELTAKEYNVALPELSGLHSNIPPQVEQPTSSSTEDKLLMLLLFGVFLGLSAWFLWWHLSVPTNGDNRRRFWYGGSYGGSGGSYGGFGGGGGGFGGFGGGFSGGGGASGGW